MASLSPISKRKARLSWRELSLLLLLFAALQTEKGSAGALLPETNQQEATRGLESDVFSSESDTCHLCLNREDTLAFPSRDVTSLLPPPPPNAPFLIPPNTTITCGLFAAMALPTLPFQSEECQTSRRLFSGLCGCPPLPINHCEFCNPDSLPHPDRIVQASQSKMGLPQALSCSDLSLLLTQLPSDSDECQSVAFPLSRWCDCESTAETTETAFAGATTEAKQNALTWMARVVAIISIGCSLFILWDLHQEQKKKGKRLWKGAPVKIVILAAVSVCDLFIATAFAVGPAALPKEVDGDSNVFWGARGTEGTCKAQGFFIQFGVTGVFYYMGLTLYYLLTIRYGWSETRAEKIQWVFHFPLVMGLALAFAGIPYYESSFFGCYIAGPPLKSIWNYILFFCFIPIWITFIVTNVNLGLVYASVRHKDRGAERWRLTGSKSAAGGSTPARKSMFKAGGRLERAVFWQCVGYFVAGLLPFTVITIAMSTAEKFSDVDNIYYWNLFAVSVAPSQAIWNLWIHKRPCGTTQNPGTKRSSKNSSSGVPSSLVYKRSSESATAGAEYSLEHSIPSPNRADPAVTWDDEEDKVEDEYCENGNENHRNDDDDGDKEEELQEESDDDLGSLFENEQLEI